MDTQVIYRSELELLTYRSGNREVKYRVYQIYGQKYIKIMDSPAPLERTTEVYASNIPRNISVENLFKFFAQSGEIYQIRLLMDFSGCNRGRCFVQYFQVLTCRRAVCCLHDEIIENEHRVVVKLSLNNNQLILKSIPSWISEAYMRDFVVRVIGEGLTGFIMKKSKTPYKNYCFCTYRDHQFAIMAHKKAWPYLNIEGVAVDVHWAIPELLRYSANLYFTNFCSDMTKTEFFNVLAETIDVKTVVQFRIANFYGFITFTSLKSLKAAEIALKHLTIRGLTLRLNRIPFKVNSFDDQRSNNCWEKNQYTGNSTSNGGITQPFYPYGWPFQVNMPIFMPPNTTIPPVHHFPPGSSAPPQQHF